MLLVTSPYHSHLKSPLGFVSFAHSQWHTGITHVMMTICRALAEFPNSTSNLATPFFVSLALALALVIFSFLAGVGLRYFGWTKPIRVSRVAVMIISSIGTVPIGNGLIRMTFGCLYSAKNAPHTFYPNVLCHTTEFYVAAIFGALIFVMFFAAVTLVAIMCFDPTIPVAVNKRAPIFAQVTGLSTAAYSVTLGILCIFNAVSHTTSWRWPVSIIMTALGVMLTVYEVYELPRYADDAQILATIQALALAWTGFTAFLATIIGLTSPNSGAAMLLYGGFPLLVIIAVILVRSRYAQSAHARTRDLTSP